MTKPLAVLRAGCKVNLFLLIGGRMENGYHTLESVFLPLQEPYDLLEIRDGAPGSGLEVSFRSPKEASGAMPGIDPADNTLTRAYRAFAEDTGFAPDIEVTVRKGIPHGAGLGGGSARS